MKESQSIRIYTPLWREVQKLVEKNKEHNKKKGVKKIKYPYTKTQFIEIAVKHEIERNK